MTVFPRGSSRAPTTSRVQFVCLPSPRRPCTSPRVRSSAIPRKRRSRSTPAVLVGGGEGGKGAGERQRGSERSAARYPGLGSTSKKTAFASLGPAAGARRGRRTTPGGAGEDHCAERADGPCAHRERVTHARARGTTARRDLAHCEEGAARPRLELRRGTRRGVRLRRRSARTRVCRGILRGAPWGLRETKARRAAQEPHRRRSRPAAASHARAARRECDRSPGDVSASSPAQLRRALAARCRDALVRASRAAKRTSRSPGPARGARREPSPHPEGRRRTTSVAEVRCRLAREREGGLPGAATCASSEASPRKVARPSADRRRSTTRSWRASPR